MLTSSAPATLTASACGLGTALTSCTIPTGNWALPAFVLAGLALGFLWPRAPWRPPLVLACATVLSIVVLTAVAARLSMGRLSGPLSLPPGMAHMALDTLTNGVILAIVAVICTSAGAWVNHAVAQAITPATRRRVQERALTASLGGVGAAAPPVPASAVESTPAAETPPRSTAL